jgi:predicted lipid carrier protein YhbT
VTKYLTQEWLDETRAMASDQPERPGASCRMNYVVTGVPAGGDIAYYWVVDNGRLLESRLGALDDAEVTLTASWEDSVSIARGDLDTNAAFMQGKVKVVGNMAKLMALLPLTNAPEYRALQERVRAITEF